MNNKLLIEASRCNIPTLTKTCIEVGMKHEEAVYEAAYNGHYECLKLCVEAGMKDVWAVYWAARNEHYECLKLCVDVGMKDDWAVYYTAHNGHYECLKLCVDAGMWDKDAFGVAKGECLELLREYNNRMKEDR